MNWVLKQGAVPSKMQFWNCGTNYCGCAECDSQELARMSSVLPDQALIVEIRG